MRMVSGRSPCMRKACLSLLQLVPWAWGAIPVNLPGPLSYYDTNPEGGFIGGTVLIIKASSETDVSSYRLYFGSSPTARLVPLASLPATGFDLSYGLSDQTLPTLGAITADHFLVFTANADGESSNGQSLVIHDRAVPVTPPMSVSFSDIDMNPGSLGGTVLVSRAASEAGVTDYLVYWGDDGGELLSMLFRAPATTAGTLLSFELAIGSAVLEGATTLLAYSANSDGLSADAVSVAVVDRALPQEGPGELEFLDVDMVKGEISGVLQIHKASSEDFITHYSVYFASSETGPRGALVARVPATGEERIPYLVAPDTHLSAGVSHFLVYSSNADGESSSWSDVAIVDRHVPTVKAAGISFVDADPIALQLAGQIEVSRSVDETHVEHYTLFFADAFHGRIEEVVRISSTSPSLTHALSPATPFPSGAAYLLVITGNADGLMSTGTSTALVDRAVPGTGAAGMQFVDQDVDVDEIGGTVTVYRAADESDITRYSLFFANSSSGLFDSKLSAQGVATVSALPAGFPFISFGFALNTPLPDTASHFVVFTGNADGDMLQGLTTAIIDKTGDNPAVTVSSADFRDVDLNVSVIGGSVVWTPPADVSGLTYYTVFFAEDSTGLNRQQVGLRYLNQLETLIIPEGTPLLSFTHLILYTNNDYGEGSGFPLQLVDLFLPVEIVSAVSFVDGDAAVGTVQGVVTWTEPASQDLVVTWTEPFSHYAVFAALDAAGHAAIALGQVAAGAGQLAMASELEVRDANLTRVLVKTRNANGDALSFASSPLQDLYLPDVVVRDLRFRDQDLGSGELGGTVAFQEPDDTGTIAVYRLYILEYAAGLVPACCDAVERNATVGTPVHISFVSQQPSVGPAAWTACPVPYNLNFTSFNTFRVVAANPVGEAPSYAEVAIVDRNVSSCPASLEHRMWSARWRILAGHVATNWRLKAVRFFEDSLCLKRIATISSSYPGTTRLAHGNPFANPAAPENLHWIFQLQERQGATWAHGAPVASSSAERLWETGSSCETASQCYVGFDWQSDTFIKHGRVLGQGSDLKRVQKSVHCVQIEQSSAVGEFATRLALQWYDASFNIFRTLLTEPVNTGGVATLAWEADLASECYR